RGPGRVDRARAVRAGERDRHTRDAGLAGILDAVLVEVVVDVAGQTRRGQFAEVVVDALGARLQREVRELVVARGAALGADRVLAVEVILRLRFGQGVGAGLQVVELVETAGIGGGDDVDAAAVRGSRQRDLGALDAGLTGVLDAVVVGIDIDEAGD